MWKVSATMVGHELDQADRGWIATPDRRVPGREGLDGVAHVECASGQRGRGITVELSEGGLSLLCDVEPELGELLRIDLSGLVLEGRVRHIARTGECFRIGVEAA